MSEDFLYSSITSKLSRKKKQSKGKQPVSKKQVHDLFVQGTNDSSIISKRSVEILYSELVDCTNKQYFSYFVKKSPRRSPLVNRAYWLRMKSIRMDIEKIISQQPSAQRINIVNLGCGYDPLPFQLLDDPKIKSHELFCIDIDFPDLIDCKSQMVESSPELTKITGDSIKSTIPGVRFCTERYAAAGCDLTNQSLYRTQLASFKADDSETTNIFIAEVSLAYMTPETADPIIKTSSAFSNSHFLILEQLLPAGSHHPFARKMIKHFNKMAAPLLCVHSYPTIDTQIERFKRQGYENIYARNLMDCWILVPDDIKKKVSSVEAFDEWEEFVLFGQHYINLHATNQNNFNFYRKKETLSSTDPISSELLFKFNVQLAEPDMQVSRKFHTAFSLDANLITCGTFQSRLSSTLQLFTLNDRPVSIITPDDFKPKVSSVGVSIDNVGYLIGGRRIPGVGLSEFWKLSPANESTYEWKKLKDLPEGRVKHASCYIDDKIVVFGGLHGECFIYYDIERDEWSQLNISGNIPGLEGCCIVWDGISKKGYVVGGLIVGEGFVFNDTLYEFKVDFQNKIVQVKEIFKDKYLGRYGAKCLLTNSKLEIIGGVGYKAFGQQDTLVELDLSTRTLKGIPIDDKSWEIGPIFIGFDLIVKNNMVWIVGGGAVCYICGSVWNHVTGMTSINNEFKNLEMHK